MRERGIITACVIMLAGVLALQGCGRKTPAGTTEETSRELTMESVETTKTEEISDLSEAKTTDASAPPSSPTEHGDNPTEESNTELHREQDSPKAELATPRAAGALHVEGTRLVDERESHSVKRA